MVHIGTDMFLTLTEATLVWAVMRFHLSHKSITKAKLQLVFTELSLSLVHIVPVNVCNDSAFLLCTIINSYHKWGFIYLWFCGLMYSLLSLCVFLSSPAEGSAGLFWVWMLETNQRWGHSWPRHDKSPFFYVTAAVFTDSSRMKPLWYLIVYEPISCSFWGPNQSPGLHI